MYGRNTCNNPVGFGHHVYVVTVIIHKHHIVAPNLKQNGSLCVHLTVVLNNGVNFLHFVVTHEFAMDEVKEVVNLQGHHERR
jgi:hypothetical protein